ncbi:unnamed protein product, partial [Prorocentrum cordatum]
EHRGSSPGRMPPKLRGPKMTFWGCSCGKDNNWASRIACSCGNSAPRRVVDAAKLAGKLPRKPAPWSKERNRGLEEQLRAPTKQMASIAQRPPSTATDGPAAGGGGSFRKERDDGDNNAFHQRTVLQEKIIYHEKALKECSKMEEDGDDAELAKCRQQLDRYEADLKSLQEQLARISQKITDKQESITAKRAEVDIFNVEAIRQGRALLVARGEMSTAKAKLASLMAKDLIAFDIDEDELPVQSPDAQEALAAFKASHHFARIQQAVCKK